MAVLKENPVTVLLGIFDGLLDFLALVSTETHYIQISDLNLYRLSELHKLSQRVSWRSQQEQQRSFAIRLMESFPHIQRFELVELGSQSLLNEPGNLYNQSIFSQKSDDQ